MSNNTELPEFLYHYTSIESLACILKYKTMRFTKLSKLNDPLEGKTDDLAFAENLVFSSSWTDQSSDSIPLWNMYTDMKGVRIKMPPDMFRIQGTIERGKWDDRGSIFYSKLQIPLDAPAVGFWNGSKIINRVDQVLGPDPVEYLRIDDKSTLKALRKIVMIVDEPSHRHSHTISLAHVGLYKNMHWMHEKEWRFRVPLSVMFSPPVGIPAQEFCAASQFEDDYLDVPLDNHAVDNIEITLGPKCEQAQRIIVQALLSEHTNNSSINETSVAIR